MDKTGCERVREEGRVPQDRLTPPQWCVVGNPRGFIKAAVGDTAHVPCFSSTTSNPLLSPPPLPLLLLAHTWIRWALVLLRAGKQLDTLLEREGHPQDLKDGEV